jgi:hypothetical protein
LSVDGLEHLVKGFTFDLLTDWVPDPLGSLDVIALLREGRFPKQESVNAGWLTVPMLNKSELVPVVDVCVRASLHIQTESALHKHTVSRWMDGRDQFRSVVLNVCAVYISPRRFKTYVDVRMSVGFPTPSSRLSYLALDCESGTGVGARRTSVVYQARGRQGQLVRATPSGGRAAVASRAVRGRPRGRAAVLSTGCHASPGAVWRSEPRANHLRAPVTRRDAPTGTRSSTGTPSRSRNP